MKKRQWDTFKHGMAIDPGSLTDVILALEAFLMPVARVATEGADGKNDGVVL